MVIYMDKKIVLSGIQATGNLTLGNYLGAIKNWTLMQDEYETYYMIADLHSLTIKNDPEKLRENTLKVIAIYVAAGLDPKKNTIFIQSHVKEHAELSWILNCYTYLGELNRMTQFKDKSKKHPDNINCGLYTYPVLMAADILLYTPSIVPVGEDQRQHLEIARDIAERFNSIYGKTFIIPDGYIPKSGARIMGLQDPLSKMSKSATNLNDTIFLNDTKEEILSKFKKAVTDSENIVRYDKENKPGISNLMTIYSVILSKTYEEIEEEFKGKGYGEFKVAVATSVINALSPIQEKYSDLMQNKEKLEEIYKQGAIKASKKANQVLTEVKKKIGLVM